jgi:Zn-finger protein
MRIFDMEASYKYFKNEACKYYPCHTGMKSEDFNCLFCYCPLNRYEDCPGNPEYITSGSGKKIKNCMNCTFPHEPENYEAIMAFLRKKL